MTSSFGLLFAAMIADRSEHPMFPTPSIPHMPVAVSAMLPVHVALLTLPSPSGGGGDEVAWALIGLQRFDAVCRTTVLLPIGQRAAWSGMNHSGISVA